MDGSLLVNIHLLRIVHHRLLSVIIRNYIAGTLVAIADTLWLEIQNLGLLKHMFFKHRSLLDWWRMRARAVLCLWLLCLTLEA